MRQRELADAIGKTVYINGRGDLYMDGEVRPIINKECKLIKQCKSGLLQVEHEGKLYQLPMRNVDVDEIPRVQSCYVLDSAWTLEVPHEITTTHGLDLEKDLVKALIGEIK